ncbi:MAG: hypothetical protein A2289_17515 [Deltaproteobacteria bacterium RIFOXYA12_FULL_58_15]|nr:MAG: hypothetical protein A2289_17515 [Deltaproteobacteria bacterium RIFOXYA12_FULL_58_15]OGR13925.1 MAG: hypothetical protein A2341_26720 [Deltaproteobacteria bacterium RIFOXYB12_FULL_58_9]
MDVDRLTTEGSADGLTALEELPVVRAKRLKPLLRGIPDVLATLVATPAAALLIAAAAPGRPELGATIYGISVVLLFAVSGTYHTPWWPKSIRLIWRRVDHSTIYILIAGSYTPMALVAVSAESRDVLLWIAWGGAAIGILKSLLWPSSPRWLNTVVYIALGWAVVPFIGEVWTGLGNVGLALILGGGLLYTLGAVIYTRRWPNPWPQVLGYHEVFHLFVVGAAALHFVAMWRLLVV